MVEMVPSRLDRVRDHTAKEINAKIDEQIEENIRYYSLQSSQTITQRIKELELEWDIERILEMNASSIAFVGTMLGAFVSPWFLIIPALVTAFLFQHATQGWCPPMPIFRRLEKRTRNEIDVEKFAMKALRGDFDGFNKSQNPGYVERIIHAVSAYQGR